MQEALTAKLTESGPDRASIGVTIVRYGHRGPAVRWLLDRGPASLWGPTDVVVNKFTFEPAASTNALFSGVFIATVTAFFAARPCAQRDYTHWH